MTENDKPPSGYKVQEAVSAWQSMRAKLLAEDPTLEDDEAALVDLLGDEEGTVDDILARLCRAAVHADDMAAAAKARKEAISGRQARYEARSEIFRQTALGVLEALGKPRLELEDMTISIRRGQPKVIVMDEDLLPTAYVKTKTETAPDKPLLLATLKQQAALRESLIQDAREAGEPLDETKLPVGIPGAVLSNGSTSLIIRVK